ncbi:S8 family serine peptidase [Actinomadura geliboluensis]|uniref:S8 family serine peptidase n=1 Tax=Actinomadura geliboluensis TaxID=882440 RepID=UPI003716DFA1
MSEAGRRRPGRTRPALSPHRLGARATAALTVLTLGAAVAVPVAMVSGDEREAGQRAARGAAAGAAAGALVGAPTDTIRSREWHLKVLRTQKAWKYSKGRGVTVAVLDTGVDGGHPDLSGRVISGPDLTGGVRNPGSRYWGLHGTSMASIIAGHGHGPGLEQGMMGVAPLSQILSVRVTLENDDPLRRDNGPQSGTGEHDAVAQGIRYAVDHGAGIINMSLGGGRQFYNGTKSQESAIKYALSKGVVLIASAGNDGSGANRKNFPAAYPGVIAVGALDRRLRLWKDSNRRSHAAVCAPGVDIVSADSSNGYVVGTGTSASSAMVAGIAALIRSRYPKLSPAEVRQALIQGSPARAGHPTGSPTCRGTVDAVRALVAAHNINKTSSGPVETPPPAAPSPAPVAESPARDAGVLLPLVLGGGGLLVAVGLVLGWRQRRRPEEDAEETDAVPDYGLPSAPAAPREPAPVPAAAPVSAGPDAADPGFAPVNVPLWQNTEAYRGPPLAPEIPPRLGISWDEREDDYRDGHAAPGPGPGPAPRADHGGMPLPPPIEPKQPPIMRHEMRPFVPGEFASGTNGHDLLNGSAGGNGRHAGGRHGADQNAADLNGIELDGAELDAAELDAAGLDRADLNGTDPNGIDLNGSVPDAQALDDADWEEFRRGALGPLTAPEPEQEAPAPPAAVSPEPPDDVLPPPVPPVDEEPADGGPFGPPAAAEDDGPHGRGSRHARPAEDEDYRPPWW